VSGTRVFRSRVYGRMHKRRRHELGLGGFRREEVWQRMAAEEARLAAAVRPRPRRSWRRPLDWAWFAFVWLRVRLLRAVRSHPSSRGAIAPHSATGAAVQGR
jgi:hypothetical protein